MCYAHMLEVIRLQMAEDTALLQTTKAATKKPKVKKDPNRVKKPMTPYIFFSNETREKVKEDNPNMTTREVMAEVGRLWGEIKGDTQKTAPYTQLSVDDQARYERELELRSGSGSSDNNEEGGGSTTTDV